MLSLSLPFNMKTAFSAYTLIYFGFTGKDETEVKNWKIEAAFKV